MTTVIDNASLAVTATTAVPPLITFSLWSFGHYVRPDLCDELNTAIGVKNGEQEPPEDWQPDLARRTAAYIEAEMQQRLAHFDSNDNGTGNRAKYEQEQRRQVSKHARLVVVPQAAIDRAESGKLDLIKAVQTALCGAGVKVTARNPSGALETMRHADIASADIDFAANALGSGSFNWSPVQVEVTPESADETSLVRSVDDPKARAEAWAAPFIKTETVITERMFAEGVPGLTVRARRDLLKVVVPEHLRAKQGTAPTRRRS